MKLMKTFTKVTAVCLLLALCVAPMSAFAGNHNYWFQFRDDSYSENFREIEHKNDNDTNWYLTINGGNMNSSNIFGARMNRALNSDGSRYSAASGYHTFSNYVRGYRVPYTVSVRANDPMMLGGKKDNASTYGGELMVSGVFCP